MNELEIRIINLLSDSRVYSRFSLWMRLKHSHPELTVSQISAVLNKLCKLGLVESSQQKFVFCEKAYLTNPKNPQTQIARSKAPRKVYVLSSQGKKFAWDNHLVY